MNIIILTPIQVEHNAILAHLPSTQEKVLDGSRYLLGAFKGKFHSFNIITQLAGAKNETMALATDKAVRHFNPSVIILAGVAGGIKDVAIGDIVVGEKYYGYEFGKETPDGFVIRPESGQFSKELKLVAQSVANKNKWHKRSNISSTFKAIFGAIASGNKVITSTDSSIYHRIKQSYNDTTAVDMEALGFGQAMHSYPSIRFICIRGISDLLDGKSKADKGGSQELAAMNMAAFVFEMIFRLDVSQFKMNSMEIQELAKNIVEIMAPIAKMEAAKKVGSEFMEATKGSVGELWNKVKPLFIEEYEELKKKPEDVDVRADARSALRRGLKGKEDFQKKLEDLVVRINKEKESYNGTIKKSKNVIQGSQVSVVGDFHLGDNK